MEIPAEFREITDKGVAHARDACAKAKVASEEAADLFKNTYATVANAATDYNLQADRDFPYQHSRRFRSRP
jgi:hypothetical protein